MGTKDAKEVVTPNTQGEKKRNEIEDALEDG
jgi:hypothetical protein